MELIHKINRPCFASPLNFCDFPFLIGRQVYNYSAFRLSTNRFYIIYLLGVIMNANLSTLKAEDGEGIMEGYISRVNVINDIVVNTIYIYTTFTDVEGLWNIHVYNDLPIVSYGQKYVRTSEPRK